MSSSRCWQRLRAEGLTLSVGKSGSDGEIAVGCLEVADRESSRFKQFKIKFTALVAEPSALRGGG